MTARLCYLQRTDRGDVLTGVRLVGAYTDDSWQAPDNTEAEFDPVEHVRLASHAAGEWIARALRASKGSASIDTLCLDIDGSACSWVTAPSQQSTVVSAAYSLVSSDDGGVAIAPPELSTVEPLSSITAGSGEERRVGLIASPDAVARLVLDELDQRGITVTRVCSLWQVLAQAWDPAGPGGDLVHTRLREDRVVATELPTMAVVMIDPAGKLIWVWSRAGQPIAGGSMRLRSEPSGCSIAPWDVSRLGNDWLAWSAQTGEAPRRVLIVSPELDEQIDSQIDSQTDGQTNEQTLSPAAFGKQLANAWPGATIDMAIEKDPLGETLARASRIAETGTATDANANPSLTSLTRRPGRAHRSAHRWVAMALLAFAGTLGAYSFSQYQRAGELEKQVGPLRDQQREVLAQSNSHTDLASEPIGLVMPQLREQWEKRAADKLLVRDTDKPKPILPELLNIALQLEGFQYDGIEPKGIFLSPTVCRVEIWVPVNDLAYNFLEFLNEASESIEWKEASSSGPAKNLLLPYAIMGRFRDESQN